MTPLPSPPRSVRLSPTDVVRREWYLLRLLLWLDDYPTKKGELLVKQLRADVSEDAVSRGMRAALRDLDSPSRLARSFVDLEGAYRARWSHGAAAAVLFWTVCAFSTLLYSKGLLDGARAAGGSATGSLFGTRVVATNTTSAVSIETTMTGVPWVLIIGLVLVVAVGRPWRSIPAVRRHHAKRASLAGAVSATIGQQ